MAYSDSTGPELVVGLQSFRLWVLKNTDAVTAARVSGYITDGYDRGMRANDLLMYIDTDASPQTVQLMVVSEPSAGVVDLSDGTAVTATDTD